MTMADACRLSAVSLLRCTDVCHSPSSSERREQPIPGPAVVACPTPEGSGPTPGYSCGLGDWLRERDGIVLEIVARLAAREGFEPWRRWIVGEPARTFGATSPEPRARVPGRTPAESMVYLASIKLLLARLAAAG
jgi:hypothetical protein